MRFLCALLFSSLLWQIPSNAVGAESPQTTKDGTLFAKYANAVDSGRDTLCHDAFGVNSQVVHISGDLYDRAKILQSSAQSQGLNFTPMYQAIQDGALSIGKVQILTPDDLNLCGQSRSVDQQLGQSLSSEINQVMSELKTALLSIQSTASSTGLTHYYGGLNSGINSLQTLLAEVDLFLSDISNMNLYQSLWNADQKRDNLSSHSGPKMSQITGIKGKSKKHIYGVNPVCPKGYSKSNK